MNILFNFQLKIIGRLCSDAELITNVWDRYDAQDAGSKAATSLITALKRLVTENPALLRASGHWGSSGIIIGIGCFRANEYCGVWA